MNTEGITDAALPEPDPDPGAPAPVVNPFGPIVAAPTGAAATAYVQREVAKIQVSRIMARTFPRDPRAAMDRILTACTRESLAESALYEYARGGTKIEGPSIRLAEELARSWGNIDYGQDEVDRAGGYSVVEVWATDQETGTHRETRWKVRHWRDRQGGAGYAVTDERDVYEVFANQAARRLRACVLAVIPSDVVEAAVNQVKLTLSTKVKLTPERINNMAEAFAKLGVTREALEKRIQRHLESITPALFVQLSKLYNSIKDGMSSARDHFDLAPPAEGEEAAPKTGVEGVKAKLAERRAKKDKDEPA